MDSYLERLRQELETTMTLTASQRMDAAPDGKWTPAQLLEHLFLTYHHTNNGISNCLAQGAPQGTQLTFYHRVASLLVVNVGYFPKGRKSPERAVPRGMPAGEVQRAILPEIDRMVAGLAECERKFGSNTKILDHPVLGPFNVGQWRKFHWLHGRHHVKQIRERLSGG